MENLKKYLSAPFSEAAGFGTPFQSCPSRKQSRTSTKKIRFQLFLGLVALAIVYLPQSAKASSSGISGFSGKTGSTCTSCHSTGAKPTVTLTGPTSVTSGSTNTYTLTVGGSGNAGLDVASTIGTFIAGTGTRVLNGEITHSAPSASHSWTFTWTAPTVSTNTGATLYGAAIDSYSGGTGTTTLTATVMAPAPPPPTKPNLTASPSSLAFSYTMGGASPTAKTISVGSSGSAISYTVASSGSWLSATGAGNTPGNVSVSVNPASLAAGTYNGSVSVSSSGAANSPLTVPVTLTVAAAPPPPPPPTVNLTATPASLAFSYTVGGASPGGKTISVGSSGSALTYTVASSGSWLTATGGGSTPGNVNVSVNPANMAAGTYNGTVSISASGASNSPMKVAVTLTVTSTTPPPPTTGGTLSVSPSRLVFYAEGTDMPSPQNLSVSGSVAAMSFTAEAYGGSWISVTPSAGTTSGKVSVSAYSTGLPAGTYSCVVQIKSGSSSRSVAVVLLVGSSRWGGERDSMVQPFSFEPSGSDTTSASWRRGAGATRTSTDPANQGLVLVKDRSGAPTAIAGVAVTGAAGSELSQLSFDMRTDSECSARAPQFVVITNDNVAHSAGCASGRAQALTASGWKRVSFNPTDPSQITPPVKPGTTVKTVALVMDKIAGNGYAVLDNINLNGTFIGKQ